MGHKRTFAPDGNSKHNTKNLIFIPNITLSKMPLSWNEIKSRSLAFTEEWKTANKIMLDLKYL